jgi:hypothetical protein
VVYEWFFVWYIIDMCTHASPGTTSNRVIEDGRANNDVMCRLFSCVHVDLVEVETNDKLVSVVPMMVVVRLSLANRRYRTVCASLPPLSGF